MVGDGLSHPMTLSFGTYKKRVFVEHFGTIFETPLEWLAHTFRVDESLADNNYDCHIEAQEDVMRFSFNSFGFHDEFKEVFSSFNTLLRIGQIRRRIFLIKNDTCTSRRLQIFNNLDDLFNFQI